MNPPRNTPIIPRYFDAMLTDSKSLQDVGGALSRLEDADVRISGMFREEGVAIYHVSLTIDNYAKAYAFLTDLDFDVKMLQQENGL